MSREVKDDLRALMAFIEAYNLSDSAKDGNFIRLLSSQHKRYFAVLTVLSEIKHQGTVPVPKSVTNYKVKNQAFLDHVAESGSDLGSALFVFIHGAYKAARQVLRSSIENFFKGIGSIEDENITKLKNTYEVIEKAGASAFFKDSANARMFTVLKSIYSELCKDVHTATIQNMKHISALGYFPNFDKKDASDFEQLFLQVSQIYACVLCLMFKRTYLNMHFRNRDIISVALTPPVRQRLNS